MIKLPKIKLKRKPKDKRLMALIICIEVLIILLLVFMLSRVVSLNSNDSILFADNEYVDTINCKNGTLIVNNVNVAVPAGKNMKYNISYSWGKNDTEYPSVPHAATVAYCKQDDSILYDISLYRDSFVPDSEIPEGKNASNWFDDWKVSRDASSADGSVTGPFGSSFLISSMGSEDDENPSEYGTSTFYFSVAEDKGVSVYILEGILYNNDARDVFQRQFKRSMSSVQIKQTK